MKSNNSEVLMALTHFVRGAARFSFSAKGNRREGAQDSAIGETRRRADVLQDLYRHYSVEMSGEQGVSVYRDTLPPDGWINERLEARSERWRVQNVDGFRCEIFDVRA
jgi:hypothetical protein